MPSFKACLLCGWCDSRGSRVATGMGSEHRPYAHEWVCGCERKEGMRFLSFLLALKSLPGHPGVLCMLVTKHTGPEGFPAFLLGWEAWKPCQWLLGLNRGDTGSQVSRQEPYSPKEAAQSPEQIPLCHSMAAGWDLWLQPARPAWRGNSCTNPTGHSFPKGQHRRPHTVQPFSHAHLFGKSCQIKMSPFVCAEANG